MHGPTWIVWANLTPLSRKDTDGLVADPEFSAPFVLKPGSPALTKLGFQPIDLSTVSQRTFRSCILAPSLPRSLAHPPTPLKLSLPAAVQVGRRPTAKYILYGEPL